MNKQNLVEQSYRALVSSYVAFVLVFQGVISFGPIVGVEIGTAYWPLVNYAMYSRSFQAGDVVNVYRPIEVVTADGAVHEQTLESLGLQLWHYRLIGQELEKRRQEALDFLVAKVQSDSPVVEVRIKTFPVVVTKDGPATRDSEILVSLPVDSNRFAGQ